MDSNIVDVFGSLEDVPFVFYWTLNDIAKAQETMQSSTPTSDGETESASTTFYDEETEIERLGNTMIHFK